jgi:hypothetical protein
MKIDLIVKIMHGMFILLPKLSNIKYFTLRRDIMIPEYNIKMDQ